MKRTTQLGQGIMIVLLVILLAQQVSAIGVMPSGRLFEYDVGREHKIPLSVSSDTPVSVTVEGALRDSIRIEQDGLTIVAYLTIPELEPGYHQGLIVIEEKGVPGRDSCHNSSLK